MEAPQLAANAQHFDHDYQNIVWQSRRLRWVLGVFFLLSAAPAVVAVYLFETGQWMSWKTVVVYLLGSALTLPIAAIYYRWQKQMSDSVESFYENHLKHHVQHLEMTHGQILIRKHIPRLIVVFRTGDVLATFFNHTKKNGVASFRYMFQDFGWRCDSVQSLIDALHSIAAPHQAPPMELPIIAHEQEQIEIIQEFYNIRRAHSFYSMVLVTLVVLAGWLLWDYSSHSQDFFDSVEEFGYTTTLFGYIFWSLVLLGPFMLLARVFRRAIKTNVTHFMSHHCRFTAEDLSKLSHKLTRGRSVIEFDNGSVELAYGSRSAFVGLTKYNDTGQTVLLNQPTMVARWYRSLQKSETSLPSPEATASQ